LGKKVPEKGRKGRFIGMRKKGEGATRKPMKSAVPLRGRGMEKEDSREEEGFNKNRVENSGIFLG